jgi:1,4-dihydroxy-2-naphthoate octaprenyltransferase
MAMLVAPFVLVGVLIGTRYFTPAMVLVLLALPALFKAFPFFLKPKPETRPEGFPDGQGGWPLYFAPTAFVYTRSFGAWFLLGLVAEAALRIFLPAFWR